MQSFKIKEKELIEKVINPNFTKLVIIGKNGVGKTTFVQSIINKLDTKGIKSYFIKADLNIDKELKTTKDNNLQKVSSLLNELTNFVYKITKDDLSKYFNENQSFKEFCEKNESNLTKVQEWMDNNFIDKKLEIDKHDSDLKLINVNKPKLINNNIFELNYHQKINMGSVFSSISDEAGTGQYFYTLLKLINKILEFCSETKGNYLYLIIDEPENLCHPELIIKIAKSLKSINNKIIKVICISHSNIFVNNFIENLNQLILMENHHEFLQYDEVLFLFKTKPIFDKIQKIFNDFESSNNNKIKDHSISLKQLKDIYMQGINSWFYNWSIKNDFINALFYNKIIICEGINDEYFLNSLFLKTNIFILKSFGKFEIIFLLTLLKLFNKTPYTIYDSDIMNNSNKNNEWNKFWDAVNLLLATEHLLDNTNSFKIKPNLESFLELNQFKQYMSRMNLFIKNNLLSESKISKIINLQSNLKINIETFFDIKTSFIKSEINNKSDEIDIKINN